MDSNEGRTRECTELRIKKIVGMIRIANNRKEKTTFCIIDAQSVRNTDTAENKGYDAGKKVSGIKRHIAVDTNGLPHALYISTANVTDRKGAIDMVKTNKDNLNLVANFLGDGSYTGQLFANCIQNIIHANVQIVKRNALHRFVVLPKRWVVERSFSWLDKCRRLWKNCERKLNSSLHMTILAFLSLLLRRF